MIVITTTCNFCLVHATPDWFVNIDLCSVEGGSPEAVIADDYYAEMTVSDEDRAEPAPAPQPFRFEVELLQGSCVTREEVKPLQGSKCQNMNAR